MILASRKYGEQGEVLMILHGLFGQSDNWAGIARKLSESLVVYTTDLRNHGDSPHAAEMSYELMADDVAETIRALGIAKLHLAGHSMGGKVAMVVAQKYPELLKSLVVIDISPRRYEPHHQKILAGLNALVPASLNGRAEADQELETYIPEAPVRQFLLKNLSRAEGGGFEWKFNLKVITEKIEEVGKATNAGNSQVPSLFYSGEKSNYVKPSDYPEILHLFPQAEFKVMSGAGHWLHAENPTEMIATLYNWVNRNANM